MIRDRILIIFGFLIKYRPVLTIFRAFELLLLMYFIDTISTWSRKISGCGDPRARRGSGSPRGPPGDADGNPFGAPGIPCWEKIENFEFFPEGIRTILSSLTCGAGSAFGGMRLKRVFSNGAGKFSLCFDRYCAGSVQVY